MSRLNYIEGSQVMLSRKDYCSFRNIDFVLTNIVDSGEMPHYVAFYLGLQCLAKYPFWGFFKGLRWEYRKNTPTS